MWREEFSSDRDDRFVIGLVPPVAQAHQQPTETGDRTTSDGETFDRATFEQWYEEFVDDIFGYLARRVGQDIAEDLTAEVFIRAWRSRDTYCSSRGVPRAWLFGIAGNLMRDHRRDEHRSLRAYERSAHDLVGEPAEDHFDHVLRQADIESVWPLVAKALLSLSDDDRDVLWLHAASDLSYTELAEQLRIPVGTVRSRLSRARTRLARSLARHDDLMSGVS